MKKFLFTVFAMSVFFSSAVYADVKECRYTGDTVRIYITDPTDMLIMINEISDSKNLYDDSIVYIDYSDVKTTQGNAYFADIPVGSWYDGNKSYVVRINGEKEIFFFGDVDLDGTVTNEDAKKVLSFVTDDKTEPNDLSETLADIDNDGFITANDTAMILKIKK